ncbi:hypothetical protein BST81_10425 [Leptolyngbya sp. 'hensonii']|nr:hypothetical protein BST81_10425 [Leptolyngbya sp. 'hensonii']
MDSTRLLFDLQQVNAIVQSLGQHREAEAIAKCTTDGLIEKFHLAFARIWLMEPGEPMLRLVASSGMYTRTDGFFAKVPVGAFKVGKIAQNRIPFLSNHLPDEAWVRDRDWAIAHRITGFAGYPLAIGDRVVGVLAVFSHHPLSAEFLEVLQGLCTTLALTLDHSHRQQQSALLQGPATIADPLSEQLAQLLPAARLSLVGTERSLSPALSILFLHTAEVLRGVGCASCRLSYTTTEISLEALVIPPPTVLQNLWDWTISTFGEVNFAAALLGGMLQTFSDAQQQRVQMVVRVPYPVCTVGPPVRIYLTLPFLQLSLTRLAYLAGLKVCTVSDPTIPLLTDDLNQAAGSDRVLWFSHDAQAMPKHSLGRLNLSITPDCLRQAVTAAIEGQTWSEATPAATDAPSLSERECEILTLLAQGWRDRDVARELIISESTVKFHLNNVLAKLNARTRYQALYKAMLQGWIR